MAQRDGLAAISLRDLAERVGLRQPSLYVYFGSKSDLYDAMFADGYRQLLDYAARVPTSRSPPGARPNSPPARPVLQRRHRASPAPLPAHHPRLRAVGRVLRARPCEFYALAVARLAAAGVSDQADVDVFSALVTGLAHQQIANDPGGKRWVRQAGRVVDMFLADVDRRRSRRAPPKKQPMNSATSPVSDHRRHDDPAHQARRGDADRRRGEPPFGAALRALTPADWSKPTDCTRWDVKALAAHVIGSAAGQASLREFIRQVRTGKPIVAEIGAQYWWDGMNELQVRERDGGPPRS